MTWLLFVYLFLGDGSWKVDKSEVVGTKIEECLAQSDASKERLKHWGHGDFLTICTQKPTA